MADHNHLRPISLLKLKGPVQKNIKYTSGSVEVKFIKTDITTIDQVFFRKCIYFESQPHADTFSFLNI